MNPLCGMLTSSIRELGKKHGVNNEIYLKGLYTRWATTHTNDEVFDDKALLAELALDSDKADKLHLNEFGVIPSYEAIQGVTPENGNIAGVNKEGNIKLYVDTINGIEDFLRYVSGRNTNSVTSQQKAEVLKTLSEDNIDLRFFEDLLKSKKDILAFILFHEKSHIMHRDDMNYDVNNLLGENQINIEARATLDAIEEFKEWKKKQIENEQKKNIEPETLNIWHSSNENADLSNFAERPFDFREGYEDTSSEAYKYFMELHPFLPNVFKTVEHAFHSFKFAYALSKTDYANEIIALDVDKTTNSYKRGEKINEIINKIYNAKTAAEARKIGNTRGILNDEDIKFWDENSSEIMKFLIKQSFKQNPKALQKLLNTGNSILTHTQDNSKWKTEFPKILMEIRKELNADLNNINLIFQRNLELSKVGTIEEYAQYIQTIFPNSVDKSIYWHGSDSDFSEGFKTAIRGEGSGAAHTKKRNDFYLAKQAWAVLQYVSGVNRKSIDKNGFAHWNKLWWEFKEIMSNGRRENNDWKDLIINEQNVRQAIPNKAGVFNRDQGGENGKWLKERKADYGYENKSDKEFFEEILGVKWGVDTFNTWTQRNAEIFKSLESSEKGIYPAIINTTNPIRESGQNTYYEEQRGLFTQAEKEGNDAILGEKTDNEFGSDIAVVFNNENVYFLGTPEDITNFKNWKQNNQTNQFENQIEELPENAIEKSPVGTNVIEYNLNTPKAKLNDVLLANVQVERAKLIANQFYQICDEYIEEKKKEFLDKGDFQTVLEWEGSAIGRAKALRYLDVKNLIKDLYDSFIDLADTSVNEMVNEWGLSVEEANHRKIHYNIIVAHFAPLLEMACPQIEKDCGLRLVITANQVSNGTDIKSQLGGTFIDMSQSYNENPNMQDNDKGARTNGNDGWSYKARQTDPHSTISLVTKNILRRLPQLDNNGRPLKDDLGNTKYLDEEFAHALLIQGLGNMINSNDFCIVTETEDDKTYEFPELTQLALKYPWVENIIEHLTDHPEDIPAFYTDFRNTFIAYYKLVGNKLVSMNQASTNGSSVMIQIKRDYEQGNPLSNNPIYNTLSEINVKNLEYNKELLKDIQEELQYLDISDEDEVKTILDKVVDVLRSIGVDVNFNDVNALWHLGNNQYGFKEVLGSISTILDKAHSAEAGALITLLNSDYVEIAKKLSKVTELENLSSFREGDKTYYSFSAPNFADIQIAYFKSDKYRDQYITENFSQFKWFTTREGMLRNGWIKQIATNDYIRQNIDSIELKNINGVEYEDWTGEMIDKAFISAFFSKYTSESNIKFGYYHYPIFSDSPVAKFIKMVRYHNNVEENIIPLLREVVKQELFRIDHVNKRAKAEGVSKIGNYDKVGRKFCFFPALNDYVVNGKSFLEACNETYNDEGAQNLIIDSALKEIMDIGFEKFLADSGSSISEQDLKDWGIDDMTKEEALKEYYWNSVYAQTQIIQMTVTDLAFYKDATDFQKRYKEVYAAGKRLFTNSKYGRKNENVIYLADYVRTSTAYDRFKAGLTKALNEGRINKMDYDSILYKFRNVNVTDAQGFRTLESYRSVLDMMGQWTPVMEDAVTKMLNKEWDMSHFNIIWQTIKPFLFSTTIKPDGLGDIMKVNHQNKDSEFLLLAVMDMISASADSPQIQALNEFMLANNIDLALYESGCKAGKQGVIDINYNYKKIAELKEKGSIRVGERVFNLHVDKWNPKLSDIENIKDVLDKYLDNGTILQGEYNDIFDNYLALTKEEILEVLEESVKVKEPQDERFNRGERPNNDSWFNPNTVHTFSYEDYMIAQPTPEHLLDAETIFGSQFRNLIISDLPVDFECEINGVKYNRKEVHDLYNSLIIGNLIDAFGKIKEEFKDIHAIQRKLMSMVQDNAKFDRDIIQALEIVKVTNPLTGQEEETFNIPLNNPSTTEKLQQLILSAFKNGITKQYIRGGNAILVSDIGYTKELNVVKKEDGTLVGVECYLPATSKDFFEPLLKTVTNPETGEAYQILDFNELDDDLKQALGYRIPTEHKYSMVPLIIKGFLPQQNGSSIMVAEDVTTLSGCDFDVKIC